jgi:Uma2 family endonuclease
MSQRDRLIIMQQETPKTALSALMDAAPTNPDEFLVWSSRRRREEGKFELSRGRVTCNMINASKGHARVCKNLLVALDQLLEPERFDICAADFAVRTPVGLRSPDIVIDAAGTSGRLLETGTPIFIAEVLSPSTTGTDFTEKLEEYTAIASLQTYLICSQDEPRAWVWSRESDGSWPKLPRELVGREETIALGGLGIELAMSAVFRGIPDAPTLP